MFVVPLAAARTVADAQVITTRYKPRYKLNMQTLNIKSLTNACLATNSEICVHPCASPKHAHPAQHIPK